jgi:anti-sigma regulatory factor (Ser/Thr protein kinase)
MAAEFRRLIQVDLDSMARMIAELVEFLEEQRAPPKVVHDAQLVCEELIANSIRHALKNRIAPGHRIAVCATLEDVLTIVTRDDLPRFDPTMIPPGDRPKSVEEASIGGLGLEIVRRTAKSFRWRLEEERNVTEVQLELQPRK